jgi:hypothetical protein
MFGLHVIKTWSSTQPSISLSSGEAEYHGVVKAAGLALGQQSLMRDLGIDVRVRVWTDSNAAIGICGRSGLGKLRHVQTHTLGVQERVRTGAIELRKVHGDVNPADLFTKHLSSRDRINQLVQLFNCEFRDGRAMSAPSLRNDNKTTAHGGTQGVAAYIDSRGSQTKHEATPRQRDEDYNNDYVLVFHDDHQIPHDAGVLPHEYEESSLEKLFPKAVAPPLDDEGLAPRCICFRPECAACFPRIPAETPGQCEAWSCEAPPALVGPCSLSAPAPPVSLACA